MHSCRSLLFVALLAACGGAHAKKSHPAHGEPGQFDYYAVSMSWSPSYCADHRDRDQCDSGRQLGFVMHGLWPQYEAGYPQSCSTDRLESNVRGKYASVFPSPKMIGHEWDKHGTCSGLDPASYFALSAKLKEQLAIPPAYQHPAAPLRVSAGELAQAFKAANPGMARDGVLPFCGSGGRFLSEIHACYDKGGKSRSCSAGEIKRSFNSCRQESFLMPSVR